MIPTNLSDTLSRWLHGMAWRFINRRWRPGLRLGLLGFALGFIAVQEALAQAGVNDPPTGLAITAPTEGMNVGRGTEVSLDGTAEDVNGDTLTYTWTWAAGDGSTITITPPDPTQAAATWMVPGDMSIGSHTLTLTVSDGNGGDVSQTVNVMVIDTPVTITGDTEGSVTEGAPSNTADGTLMVNTALPNKRLMTDGTPTDTVGTATSLLRRYGTFELTPDDPADPASTLGEWTYTLRNSAEGATDQLAAGQMVTLIFTVEAAARPSVTENVTITISGTNDAPRVNFPNLARDEVVQGTALDLRADCIDVDRRDIDTLRCEFSASPAVGSFSNLGSTPLLATPPFIEATATWTAPTDYTGAVSLSIQATDIHDESAVRNRVVTVVDVLLSIPPAGHRATITEDDASATGTLSIETADPADRNFIAHTTEGTYGTFMLPENGEWTYTVNTDMNTQATLQALAMGDDPL